jgi:signal transduction histidine kinase
MIAASTDQSSSAPDLDLAARASSCGLLTLGEGCRISSANLAAAALVGRSPDTLLGTSFCQAFQGACNQDQGGRCLFARGPRAVERRVRPRCVDLRTPTGTIQAMVEWHPIPRTGRGAGPFMAVTVIPVSLFGAATAFGREAFATALHDVGHAATVQQIAVNILERFGLEKTTPSMPNALEMLSHSTQHLLWYIEHLQTQARFELGKLEFSPEPVPVRPLLERVAENLRPILWRRSQTTRIRCAVNLSAWVDPASLDHMLTNLLINASKTSVEGDTFVLAGRRLADAMPIELSVRDHGPGLSTLERRVLFSGNAHGLGKAMGRRIGLGLASVRLLAERQGGRAGCAAPSHGPGARFWIRLPATEPDRTAPR